MSFKTRDRQSFIVDAANAYAARRISKREFLRRMGIGRHRLLGLRCRASRHAAAVRGGLVGTGARRRACPTTSKWLNEVGSQVQGHDDPLHLRSDAADHRRQPDRRTSSPRRPASMSRSRSSRSSRCCRRPRTTCRASSAPTTSTISTSPGWRPSPQDTIDPLEKYKSKPDLAMPGFDWDDFSKPLVDGISMYEGKWSASRSTSRSSS